MFDFHEKRKIRSILYSKVSVTVLLLISFFVGMSAYERYAVEREMAAKLEEKRQKLESLQLRATALEADVAHLQNERGIEEELRGRFDVVKEGEQVVIIIDDESETPTQGALEIREMPPSVHNETSVWSSLKFWE